MTASERLSKLIKFPGWGDPENAIWFVGIEEAGEWTCCEFYKSRCKELKNISTKEYYEKFYERDVENSIIKDYTPGIDDNIYFGKFDEREKCNPTYLGISKFYCNIFESNSDARSYLFNELCKPSKTTNSFLSNLNPLGVKNINEVRWNQVLEDYTKIFGITNKSKTEYEKEMISKRKIVLSEFYDRIKKKPKVVIAFGYSNGKDKMHEQLLRTLLKNDSIVFEKTEWLKVNASSSLIIKQFNEFLYILLPHFRVDRTKCYKSIKDGVDYINLYDLIRKRLISK